MDVLAWLRIMSYIVGFISLNLTILVCWIRYIEGSFDSTLTDEEARKRKLPKLLIFYTVVSTVLFFTVVIYDIYRWVKGFPY